VNGGKWLLQKYDPNNLRFKVGDHVEARIGPGDGDQAYASGTVVDTLYREPHWASHLPPMPYQIHLDADCARRSGMPPAQALIFSVWDDDHQVRLLSDAENTAAASTY